MHYPKSSWYTRALPRTFVFNIHIPTQPPLDMEKKWIVNDERSRRIALAKAKSESFKASAAKAAFAEKMNRLERAKVLSFQAKKSFEDKERKDMLQRRIKFAEEQDMKQARIDNNYNAYVTGKQQYARAYGSPQHITPKHEWINSYANDDWRPNKKMKWSDGWNAYQPIQYSADPIINDKLNAIDKELARKTDVFNRGLIKKSVFDYEVGLLKNDYHLVKNVERKAIEDKMRTIAYNKTRNFFLKR